MNISIELALTNDHYFDTPHDKSLIVWHFTAGTSARSAHDTWVRPDANGHAQHVSTAYVVDPDGTIYQMFDPRFWGYALGMTEVDLAWANDKRAIEIEIANVGPLKLSADGKSLNWWWPANFTTRYCGIEETSKYVKSDYRGYGYYAAFPQPQVDAVYDLTQATFTRFSIPARLPPPEKFYAYDPMFFTSFKGIASHQNFRRDKCDIGPAWPVRAL